MINRPVAEVWNFIADLKNSPRWTAKTGELGAVVNAYRRYQALGDSWADYRAAQAKGEPGAAQMGKEAREEMAKLESDLKDLIEKPRAILQRFEQPITG